ncbi:MAG: hypothetical protein COA43_11120 [Robiginitomaculum sp.]|nr:MAG: hypothetical protein COA43_11120 [Robiginitomaculum sp.]
MTKTQPRQPRYRQIFVDVEMAENACVRWIEVVKHLEDNDLITQVRLRIADRYVRALVEYDDLYEKAIVDGPVKEGPNGGDVFNFVWSAVEKLNDRIAKFEDSLLVSPKAVGDKLSVKPPAPKQDAASEFGV